MANQRARVPVQMQMFPKKRSKANKASMIKVLTHGVAINGRCRWLWVAVGRMDKEIASKTGSCGAEYGSSGNTAKFHGVIEALRWLATAHPDEKAKVVCDVEFIVRLINGQNNGHQLHTKQLNHIARDLLARTKATVEWIPSSQNTLRHEISAQGEVNPLYRCNKSFAANEFLSNGKCP
jgi:ribonuclease HI